MPIRFRRTLRIGPGVKLNFSKSGISTTVGPKGFHFTFGKRGVRRSIGIPGTGISEVDYIRKNEDQTEKEKEEPAGQRPAEKREHHHKARAADREPVRAAGHSHHRAASGGSTELRNAFVLLGIVVFFFAGAAVLGLMPAHFLSNSLQYVAHIVQTTGH